MEPSEHHAGSGCLQESVDYTKAAESATSAPPAQDFGTHQVIVYKEPGTVMDRGFEAVVDYTKQGQAVDDYSTSSACDYKCAFMAPAEVEELQEEPVQEALERFLSAREQETSQFA